MSELNKNLKVYVVGTAKSYASFLKHTLVEKMEDADLVLFTGGSDVNPSLYKEAKGKFTSINSQRDVYECIEANKAIKLNKPIWGTCRGIQLGCVISGGKLVQHMNHPHQHDLTLYDGTVVQTNSLHHQLQRPNFLHPTEYVVAGYSRGLSNIYLNGENKDVMLPSRGNGNGTFVVEPELVYYRKTNWFGLQGHPEMMGFNSPINRILRRMIDLQIDGTLDIVLTLDIPVDRYLEKPLIINEDESQMYDSIIEKRVKTQLELEYN